MTYKVIQGNNINVLKTYPDNHFDSIVTDPPYGIDFLGKSWDANTGALETYQECLRVLKPGGHILAFSAARTYHHLAITLEQAGFEIRDQIMWIYSSGFPKSQDVGKSIQRSLGVKETKKATGPKSTTPRKNNYKNTLAEAQGNDRIITDDYDDVEIVVVTDPEALQWAGWGTQLKPAHEPICMARKPLKQSIVKNVQEWGVGALNIDATRIPLEHDVRTSSTPNHNQSNNFDTMSIDQQHTFKWTGDPVGFVPNPAGRFPSNVLGEIEEEYQKYFYCPKVSRAERHIGHETLSENIVTEASMLADMSGYYIDNNGIKQELTGKQVWLPQTGAIYVHGLKEEYRKWCQDNGKTPNVGNNHPTVKPIELMKYLILLITPPGGKVLDPFNGSGSTGCAAVELGFDYTGIDLDANYVDISLKRIDAWTRDIEHFNNLFQEL